MLKKDRGGASARSSLVRLLSRASARDFNGRTNRRLSRLRRLSSSPTLPIFKDRLDSRREGEPRVYDAHGILEISSSAWLRGVRGPSTSRFLPRLQHPTHSCWFALHPHVPPFAVSFDRTLLTSVSVTAPTYIGRSLRHPFSAPASR